MEKKLWIIIACVILLAMALAAIASYWGSEGFSDKSVRAKSIFEWWQNNGSGANYAQYKRDLNSDIVEYRKTQDLFNSGKLSIDNIIRSI